VVLLQRRRNLAAASGSGRPANCAVALHHHGLVDLNGRSSQPQSDTRSNVVGV